MLSDCGVIAHVDGDILLCFGWFSVIVLRMEGHRYPQRGIAAVAVGFVHEKKVVVSIFVYPCRSLYGLDFLRHGCMSAYDCGNGCGRGMQSGAFPEINRFLLGS